jgi:hypothetical protein
VSNGRAMFQARQEVRVVRNHCALCRELGSGMQHPIKVRAILAYGEGYRIEDAQGACLNINEACVCRSSSGHNSKPCKFVCGSQSGSELTEHSFRFLV